TDSNPYFRDRKLLRLLWQLVTGNRELVRWLIDRCPDVLAAENLPQLAGKMAALAGDGRLDPNLLVATVEHYDAGIRRGPALHNDEQLRRLQQLRQWRGDRLRTCRVQPSMNSGGGPLIALRTRLISRKSMGGMLTDLHSRVLDAHGEPVSGLYAAAYAAGIGGGGIRRIRSRGGPFLPNCILKGRRAGEALRGGGLRGGAAGGGARASAGEPARRCPRKLCQGRGGGTVNICGGGGDGSHAR